MKSNYNGHSHTSCQVPYTQQKIANLSIKRPETHQGTDISSTETVIMNFKTHKEGPPMWSSKWTKSYDRLKTAQKVLPQRADGTQSQLSINKVIDKKATADNFFTYMDFKGVSRYRNARHQTLEQTSLLDNYHVPHANAYANSVYSTDSLARKTFQSQNTVEGEQLRSL